MAILAKQIMLPQSWNLGLSKATAKELASRNITVNTIVLGYISTEMSDAIEEKTKENLLNQIPLGRIGSLEDIANMTLYLASDQAGYITGQTIAIDGGMTTFLTKEKINVNI